MNLERKNKCKLTGKRIFDTYGEAKEMMIAFKNRIKTKYQGKRIKHRQGRAEARRVYICPDCKGYHITKETYFREREAKEKRAEEKNKQVQFTAMIIGQRKEIWKTIKFDFENTSNNKIEISNFGQVRSFNKCSNGKILKGSLTEGYRVVRMKFFEPRKLNENLIFEKLKLEISTLGITKKAKIKNKESKPTIEALSKLIDKKKNELSNQLKDNLKKRTINYHFLIHRMVAKYFLNAPKFQQTIVTHFDYNKLNNSESNLIWMTPDENRKHQLKNPILIAKKSKRGVKVYDTKSAKLTTTQVIRIKKRLEKGNVTLKQLAQEFKVSDMQIHRIKTGENWANIKITN